MNRLKSLICPDGFFSRENKKSTVILLSAPIILTTFQYFGMKHFYLNHLVRTEVIKVKIAVSGFFRQCPGLAQFFVLDFQLYLVHGKLVRHVRQVSPIQAFYLVLLCNQLFFRLPAQVFESVFTH